MPSKANGVNGAANRGHYIIIGAGFGGLTTAIELRRKGISVQVIEAANKLTLQGKHSQGTRAAPFHFYMTEHLSLQEISFKSPLMQLE